MAETVALAQSDRKAETMTLAQSDRKAETMTLAQSDRKALVLALIACKPTKRSTLSAFTGTLYLTTTCLDAIQEAIADENIRGISKALAELPLTAKNIRSVLVFLVHVCDHVFVQYHLPRKQAAADTAFGASLLNLLVQFSDKLVKWRYLVQDSWKAYILVLTAVCAAELGLNCDALLKLRRLNGQMDLDAALSCKPDALVISESLEEYRNYVHCGLALQACQDIESSGASLSERLADVIFLAEGLLNGSKWNYTDKWLMLLSAAFAGGNVRDFKTGDHSRMAIRLVKIIVGLLLRMEQKGETGSHTYEAADDLWIDILKSLSFLGLVKVLKHVTLQENLPKRWLSGILGLGSTMLSAAWPADGSASEEDDEAAFKELKGFMHELYDSDKFGLKNLTDCESCKEQLSVVKLTVKLYMTVVLYAARRNGNGAELLLDDGELDLGDRWLTCLDTQVRDAEPSDPFVAREYKGASDVLNLALVLNQDPRGYQYGLPLD